MIDDEDILIESVEVQVIEQIGEGSFGIVLKAMDLTDNQICATKFITGGTLKELIEQRKQLEKNFNDEEISIIIKSILSAVAYMHDNNVIHRDLKPQNILLQNKEDLSSIKIADFGLSTQSIGDNSYKFYSQKCGTVIYMAPQQLNNLPYSKPVDLWSVGIIMFMLFTMGKHPIYTAEDSQNLYVLKMKKIQWDFPPNFTGTGRDFFLRITAVEPTKRYSSGIALQHPWITRDENDQIPLTFQERKEAFDNVQNTINIMKGIMFVEFLRKQVMTSSKKYTIKNIQLSELLGHHSSNGSPNHYNHLSMQNIKDQQDKDTRTQQMDKTAPILKNNNRDLKNLNSNHESQGSDKRNVNNSFEMKQKTQELMRLKSGSVNQRENSSQALTNNNIINNNENQTNNQNNNHQMKNFQGIIQNQFNQNSNLQPTSGSSNQRASQNGHYQLVEKNDNDLKLNTSIENVKNMPQSMQNLPDTGSMEALKTKPSISIKQANSNGNGSFNRAQMMRENSIPARQSVHGLNGHVNNGGNVQKIDQNLGTIVVGSENQTSKNQQTQKTFKNVKSESVENTPKMNGNGNNGKVNISSTLPLQQQIYYTNSVQNNFSTTNNQNMKSTKGIIINNVYIGGNSPGMGSQFNVPQSPRIQSEHSPRIEGGILDFVQKKEQLNNQNNQLADARGFMSEKQKSNFNDRQIDDEYSQTIYDQGQNNKFVKGGSSNYISGKKLDYSLHNNKNANQISDFNSNHLVQKTQFSKETHEQSIAQNGEYIHYEYADTHLNGNQTLKDGLPPLVPKKSSSNNNTNELHGNHNFLVNN